VKSLALSPQPVWDLTVDAIGNIATVDGPAAMEQNVACAAKTFLGELYYNTSAGVPYFRDVLGRRYNPTLLQAYLNKAALTVTGVVKARTIITGFVDRTITGRIEFIDTDGQSRGVNF
jgi:hypothetical protein